MGVCLWRCNKNQDNIIKESSIDCYKKTDQSLIPNIITSNNVNEEDEKKMMKLKYNKIFKDPKENQKQNRNGVNMNPNSNIQYTFSNKATAENSTNNEKYVKNVVKIQSFFRKHTRMKENHEKKNKKEANKEEDKDKDESLSLKLNMEMMETVFSSNSFNNSNISKENMNNEDSNIIEKNKDNDSNNNSVNIFIPFNIKNKFGNIHYRYSGYVKKKTKIISEDSPKLNSNLCEEKDIYDNIEKSGLIKEGFGKFMFNDGTEFCGIFHDDILQNYGKFTNVVNQKNNDINNINNININNKNANGNNNINKKEQDKEIIITDNINYEGFIGIYKNYIPDGFGIYSNFITNLKITGIFGSKGIYGIGIEQSEEGGYTYEGEFVNNKKEGLGTIIWKDGCKYQGEFKNNQMHGYGIIEFSGDNYYQGEIKNGKMEGFGEFLWSDKRKYIGNYKNDKRNGFGIYMSKINEIQYCSENENDQDAYNISIFVGFWKNGNMDGLGMKLINSDIKYGIWENGFKKKYIDTNLAMKTYVKWIDKRYKKLFLEKKTNIIDFLEDILNVNV